MHKPTLLAIWYYERGLMQNTDYVLSVLFDGIRLNIEWIISTIESMHCYSM